MFYKCLEHADFVFAKIAVTLTLMILTFVLLWFFLLLYKQIMIDVSKVKNNCDCNMCHLILDLSYELIVFKFKEKFCFVFFLLKVNYHVK